MDVVEFGPLPEAQQDMWHAMIDLSERLPGRWTLVGGQMVALHAAQRGVEMGRTTTDVDALLDVRADSGLFRRIDLVLRRDMGFVSQVGVEGTQHRWVRGRVSVDVLVPAVSRSIAGARTSLGGVAVQSPGANQALERSEMIEVRTESRAGVVARPSLLGAIISKASALTIPKDSSRNRHLSDMALLLSMAGAQDDIYNLSKSDLRYLRKAATLLGEPDLLQVDRRSAERVRQYIETAVSTSGPSGLRAPMLASPYNSFAPRPNAKPTRGGICGHATEAGRPCQNPSGSCPHHR